MQLTPFGTLVLIFALCGVAHLISLILVQANQLIERFFGAKLRAWQNNRELSRRIKRLRPLAARDRDAIEAGGREALEAFQKALEAAQPALVR